MFVVNEALRYRVLFIFKGEKSKKMAIPIWEGASQQLRYQETILHFVFVSLIHRLFARTMLFLMRSVKKTIQQMENRFYGLVSTSPELKVKSGSKAATRKLCQAFQFFDKESQTKTAGPDPHFKWLSGIEMSSLSN